MIDHLEFGGVTVDEEVEAVAVALATMEVEVDVDNASTRVLRSFNDLCILSNSWDSCIAVSVGVVCSCIEVDDTNTVGG